jgi:hypothetical protein
VTRPQARAVRTKFKQVQAILHTDWDPIGAAVPLDEYDSYAWSVLELLQNRASRREIESFLRWAADEAMQSPVPAERLAIVVDRLLVLD